MSEFHFIEPLWFWALIPLGLLLWLGWRADAGGAAWRRVIDPRLLAVLMVGERARGSRVPLLLLACGWLLAVIALANPTFERQPVPAFRSDAARVVLLDLSRSMLAEDLTPSRLERARYKVADILSRSADGQAGLVVFAGDAFAVSPLTDDAETIAAMLDALRPQIMPVQGSRPDRGIELGLDLLRQAGARHGEVILLGDDAGGVAALEAAEQLREAGHSLGVIGVGTAEGAPVPGVSTANGAVISRLDVPELERLAAAGGGQYATLSSTGRDLDQVLLDPVARPRALAERDPMLAERWRELGPWVVLLLLPLAALAFRRGWLVVLLMTFGSGAMVPERALAFGWADLWQRPEQQAAQAFAAGDLEQARALATAPQRAGSAAYRLGDYQDAAERFAAGDAAVDHYNRGNALARSGELQAAIDAYDQALARDPTLEDARYNRAQVEAALRESQPPQQGQDQQQSQPEQQPSAQGSETEPDQQSAQPGDGSETGQADDEQPQNGSSAESQAEQQDGQSSSDGQQQGDQSSPAESGSDSDAADADQGGSDASAAADPAQSDGAREPAQSASAEVSNGTDASRDEPTQPREMAADAERSEQAAADYRDEAAAAQAAAGEQGLDQTAASDQQQVQAALDPQQREARQAADQWLRRIPDDPAELLRRKFLYQYQSRQGATEWPSAGKPW